MDSAQIDRHLADITETDGILILPDALLHELNQCESIDDIPDRLTKPTLNGKLKFVNREGTGRCVIAVERIPKGEVICRADGSKLSKPFKYTWQIDDHLHLMGPGALDHSCSEPNCVIDPKRNHFIAARDIGVDEMVTFNYLTTEYEMNKPFRCICGSDPCYHEIRGFKHLSDLEKNQLANRLPIARYLQKYL